MKNTSTGVCLLLWPLPMFHLAAMKSLTSYTCAISDGVKFVIFKTPSEPTLSRKVSSSG
uniref:RxLR effector protein n=1 Tax=Phytophthora fragariae TaxID=53985 RepID=A0A6A3F3N1_9STRA|nr:hypothetical protein PF009_g11750 [Phytophthora fragariae]